MSDLDGIVTAAFAEAAARYGDIPDDVRYRAGRPASGPACHRAERS